MSRRFSLVLAAVLIIGVLASWPSWDFAISIVPGWHTTIFSPHAVARSVVSIVLLAIALAILVVWLGGKKKHGTASRPPETRA